MSFGRDTALRAAGCALAVGFVWTGVAYVTFGIYAQLSLEWGVIAGAFATAALCLALAAIVLAVALRSGVAGAPVADTVAQPSVAAPRANLIQALEQLSVENPLLAVCAAAVVGAVEARKR